MRKTKTDHQMTVCLVKSGLVVCSELEKRWNSQNYLTRIVCVWLLSSFYKNPAGSVDLLLRLCAVRRRDSKISNLRLVYCPPPVLTSKWEEVLATGLYASYDSGVL
jgi:hypothetical protein